MVQPFLPSPATVTKLCLSHIRQGVHLSVFESLMRCKSYDHDLVIIAGARMTNAINYRTYIMSPINYDVKYIIRQANDSFIHTFFFAQMNADWFFFFFLISCWSIVNEYYAGRLTVDGRIYNPFWLIDSGIWGPKSRRWLFLLLYFLMFCGIRALVGLRSVEYICKGYMLLQDRGNGYEFA